MMVLCIEEGENPSRLRPFLISLAFVQNLKSQFQALAIMFELRRADVYQNAQPMAQHRARHGLARRRRGEPESFGALEESGNPDHFLAPYAPLGDHGPEVIDDSDQHDLRRARAVFAR